METRHGFELLETREIPELNSTAHLYRHQRTGAQLISMQNDDENKVFGIAFRTPPADSTGVAHIMEHSVLCGSRKYPVKEPFVELMKGSLNTFLNAMTFPDKTCYPVASQNLQDFYNLVDVYLDAVFHPRLTPYTLQQEGWHYELEQAGAPLTYKGVVFNEMKGAYSNPDGLLDEVSQHSIFPDNTYGVDSGGHPVNIPDLTFEQFMDFHNRYYHPSNAFIFFYGDDDVDERLRILDEYLKDYDRIEVNSQIQLQPRFDGPRMVEEHYDGGAQEDARGYITVNWLLPEAGDIEQALSFIILNEVLIGTPASPLRRALIESGLGEELAGRTLETGIRQMFYSLGMKGVEPGNFSAVEQLIFDTLQALAKNGIELSTMEAAINQVEFSLRENNTGRFPRGLAVYLRALEAWLYDRHPLDYMAFSEPLERVKARCRENAAGSEGYLAGLIREYFLDNVHRAVVHLTPDPKVNERLAQQEAARLQEVRAQMSEDQLMEIMENAEELRRRQESPDTAEALASIPTLSVDDLDRQARNIPTEIQREGNTTILFHDLPTNGILYLDLGFNLRVLPREYLPFVPIFANALLQTGTATQDFVQLLERIGQNTGGISPARLVSSTKDDPDGAAWLFLRGKAMQNQTGELLSILTDVLTTARLDNRERVMQMVMETKAGMESALVSAGHRFVNSRLRARYNMADWISEQMGGVDYLFFLRDLIGRIESDWITMTTIFEDIRRLLLVQSNMICNVTLESSGYAGVQGQIQDFLHGFVDGEVRKPEWVLPAASGNEGLAVPAQVNYVGLGANLYQQGYNQHGSYLVITNLLQTTYLWEKVRVQGGAYGAFNMFDRMSGVWTFLSYRDPNLASTLDVYRGAGAFLKNLDLSPSELERSIIGAIGELDAYLLPDAKGYTALVRHLTGVTDAERQKLREEVLGTTREDFSTLGEALSRMGDQQPVVALGSADALATAGLPVTRVM